MPKINDITLGDELQVVAIVINDIGETETKYEQNISLIVSKTYDNVIIAEVPKSKYILSARLNTKEDSIKLLKTNSDGDKYTENHGVKQVKRPDNF